MKNIQVEPFLESLPYPSVLLAPSSSAGYTVIGVNPAFTSILDGDYVTGKTVHELYGDASNELLESIAICVSTQAVHGLKAQSLRFVKWPALTGNNSWHVQHSPIPVAPQVTYILQTLQPTRQCGIHVCIDEMLEASEKRYDELFNNNLVPLWIFDIDTLRFLHVNNVACNKYGYTREEYLRMTLCDIRPAEDVAKMQAAVTSVRGKKRTTHPSYHRHKKKDGTIIYVKIESAEVTFQGRTARLAMVADITDELTAHHEMLEANQRLQAASGIAHLGYWTNDLRGKIFWSDELYNIFEVTPDNFELTLPNIMGLFHPDDVAVFETDISSLFHGAEFIEHERRIVTPAGKVKWLFERMRLLRDDSGNPDQLEGIAVDITRRKLDETALKESNDRFKLVMCATAEAIIDWDIVNDVVIWGDGFSDLFGYNLEVYDNYLWSRNIHADDRERVLNGLEQTLADAGKQRYYTEFKFHRSNGEIAYVQHRAIFVRDSEGKAIRAIGAMSDVTESMQRTREIERQNEILREIAWIQSHVVRAPLASLKGMINLLKDADEFCLDKAELIANISILADKLDDVVHTIVRKSEELEFSN